MPAETALRLTGERLLLSGGDRGGWSDGLGDVAAALVLLCDLPQDVAEDVLADYGLARSLRGHGMPWHYTRARRHAARGRQPTGPTPTVPTVVTCDATVDLPDGRAHISAVVFRDDACEVAVNYAGAPRWASHGGSRRWGGVVGMPGHMTVADDAGRSTVASFSGGGGDGGWEGRWGTDSPLSPHTQWLEIGGVRVELGPAAAPAQVRVEPLPDEPLVYRYLWHRAAVTEDGTPDDDPVIEVLVELGVLDPADPVLNELAAVTNATQRGRFGGKRPRVTREPWARLFPKKSRRDGPTGTVPVAAATPEFDGTVVVLYDLHAQPDGFELQANVVGEGAVPARSFDEDVVGLPIAWWAEDDRGNSYLGQWGSHGGGREGMTGELRFYPGLHRKARQLTLLPTGLRHRAVIEVPLPEWDRP